MMMSEHIGSAISAESLMQDKDSKTQAEGERTRVAVLMGGSSSEREVSLSTGRQIVNALNMDRYCVEAIDTADLLALTACAGSNVNSELRSAHSLPLSEPASVASHKPPGQIAVQDPQVPNPKQPPGGRADVVFIALHGKGGEDGTVQGLLEFLGLPYTGSGVLASALAMDKSMSKRLFAASGVPVIDGVTVSRGAWRCGAQERICTEVLEVVSCPAFVKPNSEGSTFGCSLVTDASTLAASIERALEFDDLALIERYIHGTEITVGVLEELDGSLKALPVIEIVPKSTFYDYESKYAAGGSDHIIPARIGAQQTSLAQVYAMQCHALLGCRGMSRTDMIVSDNSLYVLEVNTIPGMTPTSLLPQAAAFAGIPFSGLLDRIIDSALRRNETQ